jgi:hypothetical protein
MTLADVAALLALFTLALVALDWLAEQARTAWYRAEARRLLARHEPAPAVRVLLRPPFDWAEDDS